MTGTDVILTLTDTVGGSLSSIGQPYDNHATLSQVLAGQIVSISHCLYCCSGTTAEILGNVTENAGQDAANLAAAMGLGANAATPAEAVKEAAILKSIKVDLFHQQVLQLDLVKTLLQIQLLVLEQHQT